MQVEGCSGCSACAAACPENAIVMAWDSEGFPYPEIDKQRCIKCGFCKKACPVMRIYKASGKKRNNSVKNSRTKKSHNSSEDCTEEWNVRQFRFPQPEVFAAWHLNEEIRLSSSSGGIFTALSANILNQGGAVFGAGYDGSLNVCHKGVYEIDELKDLRGSKYVQSSMGDTYKNVKSELLKGKKVIFSGAPCQVAGLYSYLGRDIENLTTCDFICSGVSSPKVWRMYLEYMEKCFKAKAEYAFFRDKRQGWKRNTFSIKFDNGVEYFSLGAYDPFMVGFQTKVFRRPSCHKCMFKGLPCYGDITIGDFWGIDSKRPDLDDDKGTSLVLINSYKGKKVFNEMAGTDIFCTPCRLEYANSCSMLMKSASYKSYRDSFFKELDLLPFGELVKKYMKPIKGLRRIKYKLRTIVAKVLKKLKLYK